MPEKNDLLGLTARWTAAVRAIESRREDRLFSDPWAALLAGQDGGTWIEGLPAENTDTATSIVLRTRFFDDFLLDATRKYGVRQVALMAAGLDTRAYRLSWPEQTRIFELDQPQVLHYKEQLLSSTGAKPPCERRTIGVNLAGSWTGKLQEAGFDPSRPTAWLLEGFLAYLPGEKILHILDDVTALAAPESWLGFDAINSEVFTSQWTRSMIEAMAKAGVPWQGALDNPQAVLAKRGWKANLAQLGEEGLNFGRWPYPFFPHSVPAVPRFWFITAQRQGM